MTNDFFNHYIFIYMRDSRRVTRNFIRAGKFSRNQGTSINMSPKGRGDLPPAPPSSYAPGQEGDFQSAL